MHDAQVGHLGDPGVLRGGDVGEGREDGGEGDVDPDVDRPELGLDPVGGVVDRGDTGAPEEQLLDIQGVASLTLAELREAFEGTLPGLFG